MKRKTFVVRADWGKSLECLPDNLVKEVVIAMFSYNSGETVPELKPLAKALFESYRPFFDEMNEKFDRMCEQRKEAGRKSAESRANRRTSVDERSISLNEKQRSLTSVESRSMSLSMSMSTPNGVQKEKEDKSSSKKSETETKRVKYGERIAMLEEEHAKLCETYGEQLVSDQISKADDWLLAHGKSMKDYAAFMRNWMKRNMAQSRLNATRPVQRGLGTCPTPDLAKSTEDLIRRGLLKPPQSHKTAPVCPSNLKDDNLLEPEF